MQAGVKYEGFRLLHVFFFDLEHVVRTKFHLISLLRRFPLLVLTEISLIAAETYHTH